MKQLTDYQALIVDLDGTLYYQKPVRFAMLLDMALHFWRFRDFLIIRNYRKLYEQGYSEAERRAHLPDKAPLIVQEWMLERPLTYVKKCKDDALIALLDRTKNAGTTLIVCSDYPVKEKLEALQFTPDEAYSADDLGHMKPDAEGLTRILAKQHIDPAACLVIGDRDDKDGMLGANMGADVLILPASKKERTLIYKQLNI